MFILDEADEMLNKGNMVQAGEFNYTRKCFFFKLLFFQIAMETMLLPKLSLFLTKK